MAKFMGFHLVKSDLTGQNIRGLFRLPVILTIGEQPCIKSYEALKMKWLTFSSTNQKQPFHFLLLETLIIKMVWQAFEFNAEFFFVGENQQQMKNVSLQTDQREKTKKFKP